MNKKYKSSNGITLVALVVTIIVLLILAGVSISLLLENNGILGRAKEAKQESEKAAEKESVALAVTTAQITNNGYGEVTQSDLQSAMDSQFGSGKATVIDRSDGTYTVTMNNSTNRSYDIKDNQVVYSLYTVIFKNSNGTVRETQQIEYGKPAIAPEPGTLYGFRFVGWDKDFSNITENLTVTAMYESNTEMTIKVNDGYINGDISLSTTTLSCGTLFYVEPNNTTNCIGWSVDNGKTLISNKTKFETYGYVNYTFVPVYSEQSVTKENLVTVNNFRYAVNDGTGYQIVVMNIVGEALDDYEITEIGVVRAFDNTHTLYLEEVDAVNVKNTKSLKVTESAAIENYTFNFTLTLSTANAQKTIYFRGYIKYRNKLTGEVNTKYTDIKVEEPAI